MRTTLAYVKHKRQIESVLLVCALVATSMIVVFPLTVPPKAKAQVPIEHLNSAALEDWTGPPMPANDYDIDPTPGVVEWDPAEEHHIMPNIMVPEGPAYLVDAGFTLIIPAMNYPFGYPEEVVFQMGATRIEVDGTLITNYGGLFTKTRIRAEGGEAGWEGIYFHEGSSGSIEGCQIEGATMGIVFEPGSNVIGIFESKFMDFGTYGVYLDGALGHTIVNHCQFQDTFDSGTGLYVANGSLSITDHSTFSSHGSGMSSLHISNATVYADSTTSFIGGYQPGNCVYIENNLIPNSTVFDNCDFRQGSVDNFYIRCDGASPFIDSCSFILSGASGGARSVIANENATGVPAHPILRQPTADGDPGMWDDTFDNSTMNATGSSSVTLQWYMDVYVMNPDGNPIGNAPVWVNDTLGNPAEPPSKPTDGGSDIGWARGFVVTELIQYHNSVDNFNPFNVTAAAFSMKGYADPEPIMNMSKEVNVTVPFNPNNLPPTVSWITTPVGVQLGLITIQYKLEDLNPDDDGHLSVEVFFSVDNVTWVPATQGGGDPITGLFNNTLYTFIWDSKGGKDIPGVYNTTVYIKIVPYDREGNGTPSQTGNFTVDNKVPVLLSGPTVTPTDTTALVEWTVDEPANASVLYGLTETSPPLTHETAGSILSTSQSVLLTGLQPGRNYTFHLKSTDKYGNQAIFEEFTFETEVRIQLYQGWNMISMPPHLWDMYSSPEVMLASIAGDWDIVEWYDANDTNDHWKIYMVGKPYGNDLTEINERMGFWIHVLNDTILIPNHTDPTAFPMGFPGTVIELYPGWNFVGYPSVKDRSTDDALSGVPYEVVQTYDAATGQWWSYDGSSGDLTEMEMGRGYWIFCRAKHEWHLQYG